jgi:hypothetical protein
MNEFDSTELDAALARTFGCQSVSLLGGSRSVAYSTGQSYYTGSQQI